MPVTSEVIEQYGIYYHSGAALQAVIYCHGRNGLVGTLKFFRDGEVPANDDRTSRPTLNYAISQFDDIIGILRYEKPVHLVFNSGPKIGSIATSAEPVGEQEYE